MKKSNSILLALILVSLSICTSVNSQVLNVPETFQQQTNWCWAGSSKSIMDFYNHYYSQCTIAEYTRSVSSGFGSTNCCSNPNAGCNQGNSLYGANGSFQDILNHFGSIQSTGSSSYLTTSQIQTEISNNRPFAIRWGWYPSTGSTGHVIVGHGISGSSIYYMDPWYGEGYKIANYSWVVNNGTSTGNHLWTHTLKLSSTSGTPPANDNCNGAITLTSNTSCQNTYGTIDNATADGFNIASCDNFTPRSSILGAGVFYKFTAVSTSHTIKVTPTGTLDAIIVVYSGGCYNLVEIPGGCMDTPGGNGVVTTLTVNNLTIGNQYVIRVYDYGSVNATSGGFNICVTHACTPPTAPTNLTVQSTSCTSVGLTWNPSNGSGITYEVLKNNISCSYPFGSSGLTASITSGNVSANPNTSYYFVVNATNSCGTSSNSNCVNVTTPSTPSTPGTVFGSTTVCQGTNQQYYINPVSGATYYTWNLPSGWSGSSNSTSISTTVGSSSGSITVTANSDCGSSAPQSKNVTVNPVPTISGGIIGNNTICQGTSQTYSINPVSGATNYTWNLPSGWTGSSSSSTISVLAGNSSGNISVVANNSCGSSAAQTNYVSVNPVPSISGSISGNNNICQGTTQTYSINPISGAVGYTWNLPSGWSGSSNSSTISVLAGNTSGNISVLANNSCGSSDSRTLNVTITPSVGAANITGSASPSKNSSQSYFATASNVSIFNWILPSGWSINSGQGTSIVNVIVGLNSGQVCATGINSCGNGTQGCKDIIVKTTGIDDKGNTSEIQVYPNPTNNFLTILFNSKNDKTIIKLNDELGKNLLQLTSNNLKEMLDLTKMARGIYILEIIKDDKIYIHKIIRN